MALLLMDTTAIIDVSKRFGPTTDWLMRRSDDGDDLGVCPITVAEFYAGLGLAEHAAWDRFFAAMTFCPISLAASMQAGAWRAAFRIRGVQLTITDTLVAAVAAERDAIVVTSNMKHYPMGVRLVDPRTA
jgi:predicted nucleic acid-binding protein